MTMDFLFLKNILAKCGVRAWYSYSHGMYLFKATETNEWITEAEAMDLVEDYLVSKIANRLETGKVEF